MFFMVDNVDIASYVDDNTPYSVGKSQCDLETKLNKASVKLFKWFHENALKANHEKCHFLSSFGINANFSLPACILENILKLLGVTIDRKLNFNEHVTPNAKATFNEGLFYVSIWLLPFSLDEHSRTLNDLINGLHKRALSLVYNDFSSSFSELLEKDKSVTIHHRNLQTLAYEIFKVKKNMENIKGNYTDLKISYYVFHHIKILP